MRNFTLRSGNQVGRNMLLSCVMILLTTNEANASLLVSPLEKTNDTYLGSIKKAPVPSFSLIDGTISSGEYGTHSNGFNQQSNGSQTTYMSWDDTNLYVAISGANTSEAFVLYLDKDPQTLVNGGTNANGTNVGFNYDGTNFSALQFRADIVLYVKNGYREYRTADGSNGWTGSTTAFGSYQESGGSVRELSIPWSALGGKPSSFNFFSYVTSASGIVYGQTPTENAGGSIGTNARYERYYTVSATATGSETPPFSRNSYVFNRITDATSFGAINVWDFTMNSSGLFLSRTGNTAGDWNIGGHLTVGSGTVYLGSGGGSYGQTNVGGNLNLIGGAFDMDATTATVNVLGSTAVASGATLKLSNSLGGDLYVAGNWTRASTGTFTPSGRAVFFNGTTTQVVTVTGGGTETFDFLNLGGSGTVQLATNTDITVNSNNGLTLASSNITSTLDLNGRTCTVSGGGNLTIGTGNRKVTSSVAGGIFRVNTAITTVNASGTAFLTFEPNTTLLLEHGFDCASGANRTLINGTLELRTNGYINNNAPIYGNASLLLYKTGAVYDRKVEWNRSLVSADAFGKPHHVRVSSLGALATSVNYPFGTPGPLGMTGNLTIDSGNSFFMDNAGLTSAGGPLTVMGNIVSAGNMTLGAFAGDDLKVNGDITFSTGYTFDAKNRAVFFIRNILTGTQTITAPLASPPTFHYAVFEVPSSGSATVVLNTDLSITAPVTGNVVSFGNANDILDLNGKTLTLGTASTNNTIFGTGTFKGSNTSNMTLLGNGSIGTLRFTTANRTLRNLTINRQDNIIAMALGTPVTIDHSLTLTKGLVDLGNNLMTLNNATTATGVSTSYVIADTSGGTGRLRKNFNALNVPFTFPIGDNAASANGSQYTPATINYTGGNLSTASMTLSVSDIKHPQMQATTDYLTRYWSLSTTGITGSAAYNFTGIYYPTDILGTESNSISGRWNGNLWTEGTTIGTPTNTLSIIVSTDATSIFTNEMSAGYPLGAPEINVVGNNTTIISGDTSPSSTDFTDFGDSLATRSSTFLIQNLPIAKRMLTISGVTLTGTHAADFSITNAPASSVIVGGTTYLVIKFTPSGSGIHTATVTVNNNDADESAYTFDIQGQGVDYIECDFGAEETIAIQDFEDSPATPTLGYTAPLPAGATVTAGTAFGATGDLGSSNKFIGAKSLQVSNATTDIVFDAIDTSNLSDVNLSMRIGAFSVGSASNGMEHNDYVRVAISTDGAVTWNNEIDVFGTINNNYANARWSFTSGIGNGTTVYDGNGTLETTLRPLGGSYRTNDGYSTLRITHLPLVDSLIIKISISNNDVDEIWAIDNIELKGKRKVSKTWNGTAWSGDGNPPTASEIIIIDANLTLPYTLASTTYDTLEGCECLVNSGNSLTVGNIDGTIPASLDFQGVLQNNGTVLIHTNSSLLQHNDQAINTGNVSIKRTTPNLFRFDYTYWSSPLTLSSGYKLGTDAISLSPQTLFSKFFKWNHTVDPQGWELIPYGNEVMQPGTGYIARAPQTFDIEGDLGATAAPYTATFVGIPNNGRVEHPFTGDAVANKWNLLGNPYPSAINIEDFLLFNEDYLDGTIYLWTHNTQIQDTGGTGIYQYSPNDYATYNFSGSTATTAAATSGGPTPNEFVASGQSFFVKGIISSTDNVVFNNSMRVLKNNNQFFKTTSTEPETNWETSGKHRIWLNLTGENAFNQILVGYIENATNGLDWGYDGDHFGGNKVSLYSVLESKNLVIQGRALPFEQEDEVPLGYKTTLTGNLKISVDHLDGLFEGQDIYLEDLVLNLVHDLKASDYTFSTIPGTFNDRFVVRYLPDEVLSTSEIDKITKGVMIWKENTELKVTSLFENIHKVTVYDILGRIIFDEAAINSDQFSTSNVIHAQQTLIVRVTLNDQTVVTKKVIF